MAKGFHYFKFIATEWLTGDIVYEDFELQGIFINVCALYWHRDGKLTIEELQKRLKTDRLFSLTDRFISVNDGFISIKFLDEQLIEAGHVSKTNSINGKKGGRPKAASTLQNKPTANRPLTDRKANESQIELEVELKESKVNQNNFKEAKEIFLKPYSEQNEFFRKEHTKTEYENFQKFLVGMFRDFTIEQLTSQWDRCIGIGEWKKVLHGKGFMIIKPALEKAIAAKEGNRDQMAFRIKTFTNGLLDEKVFSK